MGGEEVARPKGRRFIAFAIAVVLVVGVLGVRLFQLQVTEGASFVALAEQQRIATEPVKVARGLMYDRKGRKLVENIPTFVVKARSADLPFSQRERVVARLAELLRMPRHKIVEALDQSAGNRFEMVRIAGDVPTRTARVIAEEHLLLPGIYVEVESRRHYLFGPLVSHVLGWTGRISGEEYGRLKDDGYLVDDSMGKAGLELTFEDDLRGTYGVNEVQKDGAGRTIRTLRTIEEPRAGDSLELTIDVGIQREAEKALKWGMSLAGMKRGVLLVMNPQTGEMLAMVSLPAYDDNDFADGVTTREYRQLVNRADRPLINMAISEQLPPGSTYKLVTGSGGLQDGDITPSTRLDTRAYLTIGGWRYWDWNKAGWGPINIYTAFAHSSDTFFFQVAGRLGIDRLAYWSHQWGFGERTGIDLPGEVAGIIPTNEWSRKVFRRDIYPGEVYQAGIGQGFNAVTPLQLLNAYAALANGGTLYRPQLVRRVLGPGGRVVRGFKPDVIRRLPIDAANLRVMRVAARNVAVIRHTYNLVDLPIVMAIKSGTAEFGLRDSQGRLPFHSWSAGFVPKDPRKKSSDPNGFEAVRRTDANLAWLVLAYDSRTTGNAATEIAKYFLQLHYHSKVDLRESWLLQRNNFYGQ